MAEGRTYSIKKYRLESAKCQGMKVEGDELKFSGKGKFSAYLPKLDSALEDCLWGRLCIKTDFSGLFSFSLRVVAFNDPESEDIIFSEEGICEKMKEDILLYQLSGRYLRIGIIVEGEGGGTIGGIKVYQKGDNFMDTFPDVYQERNSFFHRYLSIFSTVYNDFQWDINHFAELLDVEQTPKEMLPVLAGWLGLDVTGDFLPEQVLRQLVKEAYFLNKIKGTRKSLERITEIVLGEKAVILEKNMTDKNQERTQELSDITVLVKTNVEQKKKARLMFLLEQFKPAKCSMKIVFLRKGGKLDKHTYMDMNAMIQDGNTGKLDKGQTYENIILK